MRLDGETEWSYSAGRKPNAMTAIVAADLEKSYGDTKALRGVSLSVSPGHVYGLIGPNGAGKTTLVRCLTGTTIPDAGTVSLFEQNPATTRLPDLGLLPQEFQPADRLTPRELISYYAGLYDAGRDVDEVLADVGLTAVAGTRYVDLSGGERRRTLVGTAIVNDPRLLFLDEPTTGIDPAGRRAVWSLVADLASAGTTVLLTTHDMTEAARLADTIGVITDGSLVAEAPPRELIAEYGGPSRLLIETDTDVELADYQTEPTNEGFVVENVSAREIGRIIESLEAADTPYSAVTWQEPTLETAYLELTGEQPRSMTRRVEAG